MPLNRLDGIDGRFQYIVREDGSLVVGRGGHIDLNRGTDVVAGGIAGSAFEQQAGLEIRVNAWQPVSH